MKDLIFKAIFMLCENVIGLESILCNKCFLCRRVPAPQDLPPVGQAAVGRRLVPSLRWPGYPAAAERHSSLLRLQRVHPALL
jgi:hypothetical protein